jgi:hypothetical protein
MIGIKGWNNFSEGELFEDLNKLIKKGLVCGSIKVVLINSFIVILELVPLFK